MLGLRNFTDAQPRWKNGQPHHSTIGVASRNSIAVAQRRRNQPLRRAHAQHGKGHQWNAQRHAPPKATRHVAQLGILLLRCGDGHRLERHAADWAEARPVAHDLRMHGAGPLGAGRRHRHLGLQRHPALRTCTWLRRAHLGIHGAHIHRRRRSCRRCSFGSCNRGELRGSSSLHQILLRIGLKFLAATLAAEVIRRALMGEGCGSLGRIDVHAAHRVTLQFAGSRLHGERRFAGTTDRDHSSHTSRLVLRRQVFLRVVPEFLGAALGAEVIQLALELRRGGSLRWINVHAANRVLGDLAVVADVHRVSQCARFIRDGKILARIGDEPVHTARRAEEVRLAAMLRPAPRLGRVHDHPANRVFYVSLGGRLSRLLVVAHQTSPLSRTCCCSAQP